MSKCVVRKNRVEFFPGKAIQPICYKFFIAYILLLANVMEFAWVMQFHVMYAFFTSLNPNSELYVLSVFGADSPRF